jgi:hypothetical protein
MGNRLKSEDVLEKKLPLRLSLKMSVSPRRLIMTLSLVRRVTTGQWQFKHPHLCSLRPCKLFLNQISLNQLYLRDLLLNKSVRSRSVLRNLSFTNPPLIIFLTQSSLRLSIRSMLLSNLLK